MKSLKHHVCRRCTFYDCMFPFLLLLLFFTYVYYRYIRSWNHTILACNDTFVYICVQKQDRDMFCCSLSNSSRFCSLNTNYLIDIFFFIFAWFVFILIIYLFLLTFWGILKNTSLKLFLASKIRTVLLRKISLTDTHFLCIVPLCMWTTSKGIPAMSISF